MMKRAAERSEAVHTGKNSSDFGIVAQHEEAIERGIGLDLGAMMTKQRDNVMNWVKFTTEIPSAAEFWEMLRRLLESIPIIMRGIVQGYLATQCLFIRRLVDNKNVSVLIQRRMSVCAVGPPAPFDLGELARRYAKKLSQPLRNRWFA